MKTRIETTYSPSCGDSVPGLKRDSMKTRIETGYEGDKGGEIQGLKRDSMKTRIETKDSVGILTIGYGV